MRRVNVWIPAALVVGAVAGFAVVGRSTPISGDMVLTLDATASTVPVSSSSDAPTAESSSSTSSSLAPDQAAARVVIAYTEGWEQDELDAHRSALVAQGLTDVIFEMAEVSADTTRMRVGAGFDDAAALVVAALGLSNDVAETAPVEGDSSTPWSTLDEQADVLVLLGTDMRG